MMIWPFRCQGRYTSVQAHDNPMFREVSFETETYPKVRCGSQLHLDSTRRRMKLRGGTGALGSKEEIWCVAAAGHLQDNGFFLVLADIGVGLLISSRTLSDVIVGLPNYRGIQHLYPDGSSCPGFIPESR